MVLEDAVGRLQVKGVSVTSGYYQSPELTRATIDDDGWLETGDLGFLRRGTPDAYGPGKRCHHHQRGQLS